MKVLIACEYSGRVRNAFREKGHDAWSCDLEESEDGSPFHIQGDVMPMLNQGWDLMIAHPPCTYMTNAGVRWLKDNPQRWLDLEEAARFFLALWNAPIPKKCLENPIMHKYAKDMIGIQQDQVIQPWMFGHMEQKATCLWIEGLEPLIETSNVKEQMLQLPYSERAKIHCAPPGKDRWKFRSRTYSGIAQAMAEQWG